MPRSTADRLWRAVVAGLCGNIAHGTLMVLKERMGWLPAFQPYQDLQRVLGAALGESVQPALPWLLSFINGTLIISLAFSLIYSRLPGRSGAAKGLVLGLVGWVAMGLFLFPMLGRGPFASDMGLGPWPAAFSLAMVLAYSVFVGIAYAALDRTRSTHG
ncbi:hypothetical protein C2U70_04360 [Bradyrhizobium guangdongense]|nr:hypothetical protein C2U70_04360 [Bradyrhizobium guangdongense]